MASSIPPDPMIQGLNEAQRQAVTSSAEVLQVLAPPGSGKTKTLTCRVAWLLSNNKYKPWNIIVATFTVKAAREMKERIGNLLGNGLESKLVLGTFHSICFRYLCRYGHLIDLKKGFGVADTSDSQNIIKRIIKRPGRKIQTTPRQAQSRISTAKAKGKSVDDLAKELSNVKYPGAEDIITIWRGYEEVLANSNLLDYDDLLVRSVQLLQTHPACVSNIESVLVDEFQDTNTIQYELMNLFASNKMRITIVGDPDQSIYSFRSAEIKNLDRMTEKYKDTQVIYLENNYRSSGAILLAAVEVIQQDKARADRPFAATHPVGTRPVMRTLPGAGDEAQWIVKELNRVRALSNSMIRLNDVAILVRSAALSRLIEAELAKAGLPYRMVGGFRFFDRLEIKLILDYLRVINNPDNNDALARIINVPSRKIGDKTVKSLIETAESTKRSIWKLLCDYKRGITSEETTKIKSAKKGILSFVTIISIGQKKLEELGRSVTLVELIECINEEIGLEDHLKKQHDGDYESRLANIEELIQQAAEFSNMDDLREDDSLPTVEGLSQEESISADLLGRYLATVALSSETKVEEGKEPIDQVTISTIHGAKGLEWPVVFIPAVHSGSIPHYRAEEPDEERRLLYVAMTRAKALLYLSRPESDSRKEDTSTSMFVEGNALKRLLDCYGPSLKYGDVQCMGHILGRECPPEPRVSDILDRVPSIEDDFLLAKGKRKTGKRQVSEGSYGIASGRDLNHYAAATATMNTGFVPATSHLHNLDQRKLNPIDGNRKRPASPSRSETDRCVQKTKLGSSKIKPKRAIDSFFGRKGSSTTEAVEIIDLTLSPPPFSKSSRDAPGSQRPGAAPKRHDHYRPPLPRDLSDHRPLARPNAHRPRIPSSESKAYPFLSSPPEATATLRLPEDSLAKNAVLEKPRTGPNPPALSTRVWTHPGSRTLGVRRGMDGWNARGGMGKSTTGTRGGRGG